MNWARSVKGKGTLMLRGSVALMILQTVAGVKRGEIGHGAVAGNLGDDRGGGDGGATGVAVDDGDFLAAEPSLLVAVDEAEMRLLFQAIDGAAHGEEAGAKDVVGVDFLDGSDADGPMDFGVAAEEVADFLAILSDEHFRIVEVAMFQAVGEDGSGGVDRAGPASATDLIDAGDDGEMRGVGPEFALERPAEGVATLAGGHE